MQRLLLCLRQIGHDERDHHVEAGHDAVGTGDRNPLAIFHIDDADRLFGLAGHLADVFGADDHAFQADAGGICGIVERSVACRCEHHAFLIERA